MCGPSGTNGWGTATCSRLAFAAACELDIRTDSVVSQFEAPCPYLEPGTLDEAGNLYFSNWVYSPAATWINAQAKACAVRRPAGSDTLDLVPGAGYTSTELFRLSDQGQTTRVLGMDGWSTRILKLR